jgi:hypothetical protein
VIETGGFEGRLSLPPGHPQMRAAMNRAADILLKPLWLLLALLFLAEAWFWARLEPLFRRLFAYLPWERIKAAIRSAAERLPPWAALILVVVPLGLVEPLKIFALWLMAQGQWLTGVLVFAFAQIAALGLGAFLFDLVRDRLLTMRWFARVYAWVLRIHHWADAQVAPIKARVRAAIARVRTRWAAMRPGPFGRRIAALRRRAYRKS